MRRERPVAAGEKFLSVSEQNFDCSSVRLNFFREKSTRIVDQAEVFSAGFSFGFAHCIHRKIGDIYEACVKTIFMKALNQSPTDVTYSTIIRSGDEEETRRADAYLQFDRLDPSSRKRVSEYCQAEVAKLTTTPNITLVGVGMEVRHCYQTGDSKRAQADEAMARHLLLSGILPVMPLFCN